jgi:adenosylcobyric acid synthase
MRRGNAVIARTIMVQGTASSVGKSLIVTGLCRMLVNAGLRVAPFKSQNMALNAHVTPEGGEIGRAQAVQADAAKIVPTVDMNPILLKPEGDSRSQVVVLGRPLGTMSAREYHERKPELHHVIAESLERLRRSCDVVVIEGAGSPAEINLRDRDIVNMHVARIADAPVVLVGDIDRGGVFASLVGTMELLQEDERIRIAAFLINRFRGDVGLLRPGLDFLEKRTGVPVLGVVPHIPGLRVADEDSMSLDARRHRGPAAADEIEVAVVCLPRISNFDDVQPLEHEPGVVVRFVERPEPVERADLVIVPGTKSTVADLLWMRDSGIAAALMRRARSAEPILGVCGGCQMLGERIDDRNRVESDRNSVEGLGVLPLRTSFERTKVTARVKVRSSGRGFFACDMDENGRFEGYEIHMGRVETTRDDAHAFEITERNGRRESAQDGAVDSSGAVVGTMIHGLLEDEGLRGGMLRALRRRRGLPQVDAPPLPSLDAEYDRLAGILRKSLDWERFKRILPMAK